MAEQLDRGERAGIDWNGALQRVFLIAVLLAIALTLVLGTQNYDERAQVHFLFWTTEVRLVSFFFLSVGIGILVDETLRILVRSLRGAGAPPPAASRGAQRP